MTYCFEVRRVTASGGKDYSPSLVNNRAYTVTVIAFGGPGRQRHLGFDPARAQSLGSRMTRRRFAMPCSFSNRKTARRYGFQGLLNLHSLALRFQGFAAGVIMARHGFGSGEYWYFRYTLPDVIAEFRRALYASLVDIANRWQCAKGLGPHFPANHADFAVYCHQLGQSKPTPLLLCYRQDDYNCLHQDLYGDCAFPLQVVILLSEPNSDFTGGEFVLTEQRPRRQSRGEVVPLKQGEAGIFAVHCRPLQGSRGYYRVNMRHGVSRIRSGQRYALGIIFHDAK